MPTLLADYRTQRDAFDTLLEPVCGTNILLFSGSIGSGKTTLVRACLDSTYGRIVCIPMDLRGSANTLPEVFFRVGRRLGWNHMHTFARQVAALQQEPDVKVDRNWLAGIANHIHVALRVENVGDREERRTALTESWFSDLLDYERQLLIAFDTFEKAVPDVRDWISGPFLARAAHTQNLRVLIAGQQVPDANSIDWGTCCAHHELYGVPEATDWLPVIEAMDRYIPIENPLSWLAGVCHALKGAPKDIMQIIETLPLKEGVS